MLVGPDVQGPEQFVNALVVERHGPAGILAGCGGGMTGGHAEQRQRDGLGKFIGGLFRLGKGPLGVQARAVPEGESFP